MSGTSDAERSARLTYEMTARLHAADDKIRELQALLAEHERHEPKWAEGRMQHLLNRGMFMGFADVDQTKPGRKPEPKLHAEPASKPTLESWTHGGRRWTPADAAGLLDRVIDAAAPCEHTFEGVKGRTPNECYCTWKQHLEPLLKKTLSELS